jgi:hypothetical protein
MNCPWGCDPAPCELCAEQEARAMYSPRNAGAMVVVFCLLAVLVIAVCAVGL